MIGENDETKQYLLIEDSLSDAALLNAALRESLNHTPFIMTVCHTLVSGIETAKKVPFDVILLDLNLPDSDGIDTLRSLRHALPGVPIVILTATLGESMAAQAMEEGAHDVIFKDRLDPYWIAHTIRRATSRHQLLQRMLLAEAREVIAAKRASQAKSDFLSIMSHELRNPITSMIMATDILLDDLALSSKQANLLQMIRRNGDHLLAILNDVLDLSKIEAGCFSVTKTEIQLRAEVNEVVAAYAPTVRNKSVILKVHIEADVPQTISTDPMRFRQVLSNLISNAIKFTERGSVEVHVRTESDETGSRCLAIDIRDSGIGIAPDQALRLFQAFSQADADIVQRFGGSGLGLSLCKSLAEALGGDVSLARSEPAKGSTFLFRLGIDDLPRGSLLSFESCHQMKLARPSVVADARLGH